MSAYTVLNAMIMPVTLMFLDSLIYLVLYIVHGFFTGDLLRFPKPSLYKLKVSKNHMAMLVFFRV